MFTKNRWITLFFLVTLTGCLHLSFNAVPSDSILLAQRNDSLRIEFSNPIYERTFTSCSRFSYIVEDDHEHYGKLFVENIMLYSYCDWTAYPVSFFEFDFKKKLNIDQLKRVEQWELNQHLLITYLIDDQYYINFIYYFSVDHMIFILDYQGDLYHELLKRFHINTLSDYRNQARFPYRYKHSLIKENFIQHYLEKESILKR